MIQETVSAEGLRARANMLRAGGDDSAARHVDMAADKINLLETLLQQAGAGLGPLAHAAPLYRSERADVRVGLNRAGSFGPEDHAPNLTVRQLRDAAELVRAISVYFRPDQIEAGYVLASFKRTKASDRYITLWRPQAAGYAWALPWAGLYDETDALRHSSAPDDDYPETHTYAAPLSSIQPLFVAPAPGMIDNDAGPVLPNTAQNWKAIRRLSAALHAQGALKA